MCLFALDGTKTVWSRHLGLNRNLIKRTVKSTWTRQNERKKAVSFSILRESFSKLLYISPCNFERWTSMRVPLLPIIYPLIPVRASRISNKPLWFKAQMKVKRLRTNNKWTAWVIDIERCIKLMRRTTSFSLCTMMKINYSFRTSGGLILFRVMKNPRIKHTHERQQVLCFESSKKDFIPKMFVPLW